MTHDLQPGYVLEGKYEILRLIGEGGMGKVYEARHRDLRVHLAVKILHANEAEDPNMLVRFRTEARSAASIKHPNVVEVTDFGITEQGRPFFVMELLEGESLAERLDRKGSLPEREAVEIADQILSGLAGAHRKGIIHRDLKPENVLLARNDMGKERVKILDFGIAKIVGGAMSSHQSSDPDRPQTQRGVVLGTPGYMAPEAITGRGRQDERSDLFSVGVLLFEMLCNKRPFSGATPHEIMMAAATKPVPKPSAVRPGISAAMERLILTSLAKYPEDRYQSADEFVYHLTAAAVGRVPHNARPCRTKAGLPPPDFDTFGSAPETQDDLPPLDIAVPERVPARRARPRQYERPPKKPRRRMRVLPVSPLAIVFLLAVAAGFYYFFFYKKPFKTVEHDEAGRVHERRGDARRINSYSTDVDPENDTVENTAKGPKTQEAPKPEERITVWLDVSPRDFQVSLDGDVLEERPLLLPSGKKEIELVFAADGHVEKSLDIIPDQEQTVRLRLDKKP